MLLEPISIPLAAEVSKPKCTPAADGVVGFVVDPMHEMLPHVILLVGNVDLVNAHEAV